MGVVDPGALPGVPATPTPSTTPAIAPPAPPTPVATAPPPPATPFDRTGEKEDKQTFQVSDCRSLVKTLVCGVKTITWGITSCKAPGGEMAQIHVHKLISNCCKNSYVYTMPVFFFTITRSSVYSQQATSAEGDTDLH